MQDLPDDPIVRCMERTGMPPWELALPDTKCPICGWEARMYTLNTSDEIVGCDRCLREADAVEYETERQKGDDGERD